MKSTIYELVQKRKELLKDLENLRNERKDESVEKRRVGDDKNVEEISLQEYEEKRRKITEELTEITVVLRQKNVEEEINKLELTPEEARIRRDMLDKEIKALRELNGTTESYLGSSSEIEKVSCVDGDELDNLLEKLSERRSRLDAELQRFNLDMEIEVEI